MAKDFAYRLQDYAYTLIQDDVGLEFSNHLDEWKIHCNNLTQYARNALNRYQTKLETARAAMEAERARNSQMAMLVLSLLAGPAMSFVAGTLENRLAPKLFGSRDAAIRRRANPKYKPPAPPTPPPPAPITLPKAARVISPVIPKGKPTPPKVKLPHAARTINPVGNKKPAPPTSTEPPTIEVQVFDPDWSRTAGKVLGDFGGALTGALLINPAIQAIQPDQSTLRNEINKVPDSTSLEGLKTNLENTWIAAQGVAKRAMQNYANTIREDSTWGDRLLAKLLGGTLPGVPKAADGQQAYELGKKWIHSIVNHQRYVWATQNEWFYYANAPEKINEKHATNAFEAELWAIWISQEGFQGNRVDELGPMDREGNVAVLGHHYEYDNLRGKSRIEIDKILPHLRDLGVVKGGIYREMSRPYDMAKEGMLAAEVTNIDGDVDTKAELESLNDWAANRKPSFFGGQIGFVRRNLAPLQVKGSY